MWLKFYCGSLGHTSHATYTCMLYHVKIHHESARHQQTTDVVLLQLYSWKSSWRNCWCIAETTKVLSLYKCPLHASFENKNYGWPIVCKVNCVSTFLLFGLFDCNKSWFLQLWVTVFVAELSACHQNSQKEFIFGCKYYLNFLPNTNAQQHYKSIRAFEVSVDYCVSVTFAICLHMNYIDFSCLKSALDHLVLANSNLSYKKSYKPKQVCSRPMYYPCCSHCSINSITVCIHLWNNWFSRTKMLLCFIINEWSRIEGKNTGNNDFLSSSTFLAFLSSLCFFLDALAN